jgi:hypothetical protein
LLLGRWPLFSANSITIVLNIPAKAPKAAVGGRKSRGQASRYRAAVNYRRVTPNR